MATFEDLTNYSYASSDHPMVNVGWLGRALPFTTGPVDQAVVDELVLLAAHKSNIMRGVHYCEFCDEESPIRFHAQVPGGWVMLGTGELHVRGKDGTLFSTPSLVLHYITAHDYRPPQAFLDAVRWTTQKRRDGHPSREPMSRCDAVDAVVAQLPSGDNEGWESHLADLTGHEDCIADALKLAARAQDWSEFNRQLVVATRFHSRTMTPVLCDVLNQRVDQVHTRKLIIVLEHIGDPAAIDALAEALTWHSGRDDGVNVGFAAIWALAAIDTPRALEVLRGIAAEGPVELRDAAAGKLKVHLRFRERDPEPPAGVDYGGVD